MAKSEIWNKNWKKEAPDRLMEAGERFVGLAGTAYVVNKALPGITALSAKVAPKYYGLFTLAVGLAGEIFVKNKHINAIAQGMTTYSAFHAAGNLVFSKNKADFGLSGPGETLEQLGADSTPLTIDYAKLAAEVEAMAGDPNPVTTMQELGNQPTNQDISFDVKPYTGEVMLPMPGINGIAKMADALVMMQ